MQPPTEFSNLAFTPEELRSQLPTMPSFVTVVERVYDAAPPSRADTPPPPPPVGGMPFVNYTHETFGGGGGGQSTQPDGGTSAAGVVPPRLETRWVPVQSGGEGQGRGGQRAELAQGGRKQLPVFTPDGVIPFSAPMQGGGHAVAGSQEGGQWPG